MTIRETRKKFNQADWEVPQVKRIFYDGKKSKYCLVIPVLNEGRRIQLLLKRLYALGLEAKVDILVVDGGSTDGSLSVTYLRSFGVKGLLVKIGAGGLSAQLRCGYAFGLKKGYKGIITIDGNNKDDPKAILGMIKLLDEGYDFVQASRFIRGGSGINTPKLREAGIRFVHAPLLSLASGFRWTDTTQGFRAYSQRLVADTEIAVFRQVFDRYELLPYLSFIAPRHKFRCIEIPSVRRYPRKEVPTKIRTLGAQMNIFLVLINACLGVYNKN